MPTKPRKKRPKDGRPAGVAIAPRVAARWIRTAADERAAAEGCWFDERAGEHVCAFFPRFLRHYEGRWAGQPFELLDWQRDELVMPLFGWRNPDGRRRFRIGLWFVAKKNGKTAICGGLSLVGLVGDGEQGAKVYSAACKRDQAAYIYECAEKSVKASPELRDRVICFPSRKAMSYPQANAIYEAISADAGSNEGLNGSMVIVDELHAWGIQGRRLWNAIRYAGAAREQPLLIVISTAGDDAQGIGYEQYDLAKRIMAGELDQTDIHVCIHEAPPEAALDDPAAWRAANPSLGVTINQADLASEARIAIKNAGEENNFRRYRLNQWVSADVLWLSSAAWKACEGPFDLAALRGRPCCVGLDLAMVADSSALVAAFVLDEEGGEGGAGSQDAKDVSPPPPRMALLAKFFLPEEGIAEREEKDQAPYRRWAAEGRYILTPGAATNYNFIKAELRALAREYQVMEVPFDTWNAYQLSQDLQEEGLPMVAFSQGPQTMSPACKEFERLVVCGRLRTAADPVLRWMAGNVMVKVDEAGNIRPNKAASKRRIDGIIASIMAVARALVLKPKRSVYMDREPIVF